MIRIAVDLMGGDHGPDVVVSGVAKALERHPDIRFTLFGLEADCVAVLDKFPALRQASTFIPCEIAVGMDDKPSQALRHGRYRSSMWRTIEAVKTGDADVCVSAGNT
ncbi:MAG: phosphate acyltransferase, partial [Roseibium sp.]